MAKQEKRTKGKAMRIEQIEMTPDKAKEIMKGNTHNRFPNMRVVKALTAEFEERRMKFNAQPIQISTDGVLLDGQHRLLACIASGISFECLVVWDALAESQETMDTGRARTTADILRLRGYANQSLLSAVARRIALSEKFRLRDGATHTGQIVSNGAVLDTVEAMGDPHRFTVYAKQVCKDFNFTASQVGFLIWWFDGIDRDDSDFFWDKLKSGQGLYEGDPIYTLRQHGLVREVKGAGLNHHQVESAAIIIKAWNKFRRGESALRLSFRVGGANPETFPEPI